MFQFVALDCVALASGALYLPELETLCVSDLHLGKSDRIARRGGPLVPPYETRRTLDRLAQDIDITTPERIICLGDSFDDLAAAHSLCDTDRDRLRALQEGRKWVWVEGNHDPGAVPFDGETTTDHQLGPLRFRHIATVGAQGEISGHYHPKCTARGAGPGRACFVYDRDRIIMPAYGAYTGGLSVTDPAIQRLFPDGGLVVLTGIKALPMPLPTRARA